MVHFQDISEARFRLYQRRFFSTEAVFFQQFSELYIIILISVQKLPSSKTLHHCRKTQCFLLNFTNGNSILKKQREDSLLKSCDFKEENCNNNYFRDFENIDASNEHDHIEL